MVKRFLLTALCLVALSTPALAQTWTVGDTGTASDDTDDTSFTVDVDAIAGQPVFIWTNCFNEAGAFTYSVADEDAVPLTGLTKRGPVGASNFSSQWFWYIAPKTENIVYTITLSDGRPLKRAAAIQASATGTVSVDDTDFNNSDATTALDSNSVSTSGTDDIVFGTSVIQIAAHITSPQINGVAADATISVGNNSDVWYRLVNATFSGAATGTAGSSQWLSEIVAFKATVNSSKRLTLLGVGGVH